MPIFAVSPTFFHHRFHSFPVPSCSTKKRLCMTSTEADLSNPTPACGAQHLDLSQTPSCTAQRQRVQPNTNVYGPQPPFRAKRRRIQPNMYSPTPACRVQFQRTADGEELARNWSSVASTLSGFPTMLKEERLRPPTIPLS